MAIMKLNDIFSDFRGKIMTLTGDMTFPEVTIFTTKAGKARGGCIHTESDEYTCVIEGEVEYIIGDKRIYLSTGQNVLIPKNTPHYYISKTDSIVLEWGANPEEKANKHAQTRKIVDEYNKR